MHHVGDVELPIWLLFGVLEVVGDVFYVHQVNMWLVGGEPGGDGREELCCLCCGFFFCEAQVDGGIVYVYKAVSDILIICHGAWSQSLVSVREE